MRLLIGLSWVLVIWPTGLARAQGPAPLRVEPEPVLARLNQVCGASVESGEEERSSGLFRLARRRGLSLSSLLEANPGAIEERGRLTLPTRRVAPGREGDGLVLNLAERYLYLWQEGRPAAYYPVAVGRRGWMTPTGDFSIVSKRKSPTWYPPPWAHLDEPVPPGRHNPLGDRWLGLSEPGYGLHGTNSPTSIGRAVSHGCIRLYPEHAEQVYDQVSTGTPISIIYEPVLVGYAPEEGKVYLVRHADPYRLGRASWPRVWERLVEVGLGEAIDREEAMAKLGAARGLAVAILGSDQKIKVNGQTLELGLSPTPRGGETLVPAPGLLAALNLGWRSYSPGELRIEDSGGSELRLVAGSRRGWFAGDEVDLGAAPARVGATLLAPLRAVCLAFGVSVWWDEEGETYHLTPPAPAANLGGGWLSRLRPGSWSGKLDWSVAKETPEG
jgi:L,D-transpeptidase ErfK/SrfK